MNVPFLDLKYQENVIRADREKRFSDIIENTSFVLGPHVVAFEKEFGEYLGVPEVVGVSGGTDALTMIFRALTIGEGDEVLMIPNTFIASASSAVYAGARPVFVDIDPETRDFNYELLVKSITPKTKAILAVHLYGQPTDMERLMAIAKEYSLHVVEDACQAHGAEYGERRVGTFGVAAAFSFYPGKNLGAYGDGGAVVTHDPEIASIVRALRNQGCVERYDYKYLGYNGRLDALQAAVLSAKLPYLDSWNALRQHIAARYLEGLKGLPLSLPPTFSHSASVWHLFVVEVLDDAREKLMEYLAHQGIATGLHYPLSLNKTPALVPYDFGSDSCPVSERLCAQAMSLPVYPGMTEEQVDHVIAAIRSFYVK